MNKMSLYYYFENKESLIKEIIQREVDQFNIMMRQTWKNNWSREKILAWIRIGFQKGQNNSILANYR